MTATLNTESRTVVADDPSAVVDLTVDGGRPAKGARAKWPIFGAVGAVAGFAAVNVALATNSLTKEEANQSPEKVVDHLQRGGYHAGFLIGLVSVGALLVAAAGWKRWAEKRAPDDLAARVIGQGLALTAAVNVLFFCLMGALADYLPGGMDHGWQPTSQLYVTFSMLDFGGLLGWWGAAVSAVAVAHLAFRKQRVLPRWMGVVSVLLLLPPVIFAVTTALPGFVGFTMPIWLVVISLGMVFSKKVDA